MERNYTHRNNRDQMDPDFVLSMLKSQGYNCSELGRLNGTGVSYFSARSVKNRNGYRNSDKAFLSAIARGETVPEPLVVDTKLIRRVLKSFNIRASRAADCIDRSISFFQDHGRSSQKTKLMSGELILLEQKLGLTRKMITTRMKQIEESDKRVVPVRLPDIFTEPKAEMQTVSVENEVGNAEVDDDIAESTGETPQNRFTARFDNEEWAYITECHWQNRKSITDIIRSLVREDMRKHPEILNSLKKEG